MSQIPEVDAQHLQSIKNEVQMIDVRRPDEWTGELGHIEGATLVTLETEFQKHLSNLSKDQTYVFVCRSGARSGRATQMAIEQGFTKVFNLTGGMLGWNAAGLPVTR